ncbi:uncharacterized protein DUF4191 [Propionibacteriaceae bacterium ES.041]|uniref:DUF4191 domain-containing protein n=1 Tax=Enemella evansiae TaxID=2016499 RepID=UPI000B9793D1|nr:DUF4191 domain-containing protein [Enemella evansiae]OYN95751.1 hypothetical protein CGZ96_14735 [Enemella evansiae]PFG68053.1 uncharacterized protein DUF4191 [Propionibacteriaceae bacterium ES.041]
MADKQSAKQAQAQAKADARAARRAAKERRRTTTDPNEMGRFRQIRRAYQLTHEYDEPLPWLLLGAFAVPIVLAVVIALLFAGGSVFSWIMFVLTGIMLGILLALLLLTNRTKKATFKRYAGQVGSAEVALQMLGNKWVHDPVIAATKHQDVVHRAIGPGGIVLVSEGDPNRAKQLLASEERKHEKFISGVVISTFQMGDKPGQVSNDKLANAVKKLPKTLQAHQVTDVRNRLRAIDAVRPKVPVPRGPMPTNMKGARKGMRGR